MKRYLLSILAVLFSTLGVNAMSYEEAREQAYYLTDKMAYELNLNDEQYNDAYEINLDYLLSLRTEADIYGPYWEYRNTDLRYILYDWQWNVYAAADYFYRPVWWYNGGWLFPIYNRYVRGYFWYDRPHCFWDYTGAHWHHHHMHHSYYADRRHTWNGGMRGRENTMVGHPYGTRSGRYGAQEGGRGNAMQNGRGSYNQNTRGNYQNSGRGATRGGYESNGRGTNSRGSYNQSTGRGSSRGSYDQQSGRGSYQQNNSRGSYQQSTGRNTGSTSSFRSTGRGNSSSFSGSSSRGSMSTPSRSSSSFSGGSSRGGSSFGGGSSRGGGSSFSGGGSRGGGSMGGGSRGGRR